MSACRVTWSADFPNMGKLGHTYPVCPYLEYVKVLDKYDVIGYKYIKFMFQINLICIFCIIHKLLAHEIVFFIDNAIILCGLTFWKRGLCRKMAAWLTALEAHAGVNVFPVFQHLSSMVIEVVTFHNFCCFSGRLRPRSRFECISWLLVCFQCMNKSKLLNKIITLTVKFNVGM